jgi:hypothetical protein
MPQVPSSHGCCCCCAVPQAQEDAEQISCRVHVVNNTASPDSNMLGHVRSSLKVLSAADIADVSVIVQVQHPDVAALEVCGWAGPSGGGAREVYVGWVDRPTLVDRLNLWMVWLTAMPGRREGGCCQHRGRFGHSAGPAPWRGCTAGVWDCRARRGGGGVYAH